jgi:peptidoglycan/LPS O-acetylase OafA/YrhL
MLLAELLKKENNNLDIFRLIASLMVIYGHAFALIPDGKGIDIVSKIVGVDYSGSLAVKIFFFLSGLVVTNSLISRKQPITFFVSRFFRIWPALLATIFVSVFVIGPLYSNISVNEYFSSSQIAKYTYSNLLLRTNYELPGVFYDNHMKAVNGSLWTIPFEVAAYFILASLFMIKALNSKLVATGIFFLIIIDTVAGNTILFTWLPANNEIKYLAPCFAFGSLLSLWKDKIKIDASIVFGAIFLWIMFRGSVNSALFLYPAAFLVILYLSSTKFALSKKLPVDISYGAYLWGWPVQQIMAHTFPDSGVIFNQISSIIIACALGYTSWVLIEKRSIAFGSRLAKSMEIKFANRPTDYATNI